MNEDPLVDQYLLNDTSAMYVVYIPDEKGRTGLFTLDLGNSDSAYLYSPIAGMDNMQLSKLKTTNGKVIVTATETPLFVKGVGYISQLPSTSTGIKVFPNPVKNTLTIQGLNSGINQQVTIFNSLGKTITSGTTASNTYQVNMGSLAAGIYYVEIRNNQQKQTFPFIKTN